MTIEMFLAVLCTMILATVLEVVNRLRRIEKKLNTVIRMEDYEMTLAQDFQDELAANTSATQSVVDLVHAQADQIQALVNAGADMSAFQSVLDGWRANDTKLAGLTVASTPAADEPPAQPGEPVVTPEAPVDGAPV